VLAAPPRFLGDLSPKPGGSFPESFTAFRGATYFSAFDPEAGGELWKTDGTAAGTVRVRDIVPGNGGSYPGDLVVAGGVLFFTALDPVAGASPRAPSPSGR
jgi:ELWxxDGT repeat protein